MGVLVGLLGDMWGVLGDGYNSSFTNMSGRSVRVARLVK